MRANRGSVQGSSGAGERRGAGGIRGWIALAVGAGCAAATPAALGQYATSVVSYASGTGTTSGYTNASVALGEPTRHIPGDVPGAVTPFNAPWMPEHVVQIGRGGSLVVEFSSPISNDASHLYGVDFIVFGNAFYGDMSWPNGVADGSLADEGGDVDVSFDGVTWHRVGSSAADGRFPTLGYSDLTGAYQATPGAAPSDFARPVDPSFAVTSGMTFAQIAAGYNGSGGGVGIDIASSGLSSVRFVRVSVDAGAAMIPEIDGFAVVPGVPAWGGIVVAGVLMSHRRRK